jgi:hypothetical protein
VPTPFYHLSVAEELLGSGRLPARVYALLAAERGAFLFGNTAPDVQVISRQPRQDTHFFDLPLRSLKRTPWQQLFNAYPALRRADRLPPAQAAFLAGYLSHLQADWLWVKDIFVPVFGMHSPWGTFPQRLYLHNVLRAYQDRQILPSLTNGTSASMARATPADWLPFVDDEHLRQWRNLLVSQLRPEAPSQTVEVFAARQGIPPDEFYRLLDSEEAMEREIFARVSRQTLDLYRQRLVEENLSLLEMYLRSIGDESH